MKTTTVIGIDIGDKQSHLVEIDGATGEVILEGRVRSTPKALASAFCNRSPARIVLEAGGHSGWMSRELAKWGHEVFIANPRRVKLSFDRKSDRVDAEMLARIGRVDPKLLQPVKLRTEETQIALTTLRSRDALVSARTKLVNHVRSMVKTVGARLPKCDTAYFHKRVDELPEELRPALEPMMDIIRQMTAQIRAFDRKIEQMCEKEYPETAKLRQIAGVGALTALAYILTIEDPTRFANARAVGPYLGLCPRQLQSGDHDPQLRITKAGDPMLRRLLVGAANYILGPFGPDTDLRRWGHRLAARGGKNAKKRATVAVARKLSTLLHALWRSGADYEPLRQSQATPSATDTEGKPRARGLSRRSQSRDSQRSQEQPPRQAPSCATM
jgi:transposase